VEAPGATEVRALCRRRVRAWLAVLRALDDDSQAVRDAAAELASPLLAPSSLRLHPAAVLRLGWRRLSSAFPTCPDLIDALARRVLGQELRAGGAERRAVRRAMRRAAGFRVGGQRLRGEDATAAGGAGDGSDASDGEIGGGTGVGGGGDVLEEDGGDDGDMFEKDGNGGERLFEKEADNMWEEKVEQATNAAPLLRAALQACRTALVTQCRDAGVSGGEYRRGGSVAERETAAAGEPGGGVAWVAPCDDEVEAVLLAAGRWREALAGTVCPVGDGVTAASFLWQSRARLAQWALIE